MTPAAASAISVSRKLYCSPRAVADETPPVWVPTVLGVARSDDEVGDRSDQERCGGLPDGA